MSEDIKASADDLGGLVTHMLHMVPWKVTLFVFLAFIAVNTTTFVDRVLGAWPGATDGRYPSEKGLMIQATVIALGVIVVSICVGGGLI